MTQSVRLLFGCGLGGALAFAACHGNAVGGQVSPSPSPTVVIAAVELQFEDPMPGGQAVWVVNRALVDQDVSCWTLVAASKTLHAQIASGTFLPQGRGLRLATPSGMLGSRDTITLLDRSGREVSRTPELADSSGDDQYWYLLPGEAWRFGRARLPETISDGRLVSAC
jgi:hypothetical protein